MASSLVCSSTEASDKLFLVAMVAVMVIGEVLLLLFSICENEMVFAKRG